MDLTAYILVTTNNTSVITYEYARQLGADFIMSKHQADFSSKGAVGFLQMMKGAILSKKELKASEHSTTEAPEQRKKRIMRKINQELDNIGISPKAVGYKYLADAIELIIQKPVNNLCAVIGSNYGKTDASVERVCKTLSTEPGGLPTSTIWRSTTKPKSTRKRGCRP